MQTLNEVFLRVAQLTSAPATPAKPGRRAQPARRGRYAMSTATWWRLVSAGHAPAPIKLGPGVTAWRLSDLEAWEQKQAGKEGR